MTGSIPWGAGPIDLTDPRLRTDRDSDSDEKPFIGMKYGRRIENVTGTRHHEERMDRAYRPGGYSGSSGVSSLLSGLGSNSESD